MKKARVALNGFGRIGRLVFRIAMEDPGVEVVGINLSNIGNLEERAYLLRYDSVYGRFKGTVAVGENALIVNGRNYPFYASADPSAAPWKQLEVDCLLETSGKFLDVNNPKKDPRLHLKAGARRVLLSAPAKTKDIPTFVYGVNHQIFDPATQPVVSNASCTTNCLAPVVKVVHDNFGIAMGLMATVHAYTASQNMVDNAIYEGDPLKVRVCRAGATNVIPYKTGAAEAIDLVLPALKGRLSGMSFRVPVATGSVVDLTLTTEKDTSLAEINAAMEKAANTPVEQGGLQGVLGFTKDPLVSSDVIGDPRSSVFDSTACKALKGNPRFFKLIAWYDNEYAYAYRMVDMVKYISGRE